MDNIKALLDDWHITGDDIGEFKETLKKLDEHTMPITSNTGDITLLSVDGSKTDDENFHFFPMRAGINIVDIPYTKSNVLRKSSILSKEAKALPIIDEAERAVKTMVKKGKNQILFLSNHAFSTMSVRANAKGGILEDPMERDFVLAHQFGKKKDITLIVRKIGYIGKIFAMLSNKYNYLPQSLLGEIIDKIIDGTEDFGETECVYWNINHQIAEIYIEFPEKAEELSAVYGLKDVLIPGLYLSKSDVGDCSITARGTWRYSYGISTGQNFQRRHVGTVNSEDILTAVEEKIFSEYTKLPERMCELLTINITDPSLDLTKKRDQAANYKTIKDCFKSVFKEIKLVQTIGKRNEMELFESVCDEIDPSTAYTAYDIAITLLGLPERVSGVSGWREVGFAEAIGKAPYVNFEKLAKEEEEEKLILTA